MYRDKIDRAGSGMPDEAAMSATSAMPATPLADGVRSLEERAAKLARENSDLRHNVLTRPIATGDILRAVGERSVRESRFYMVVGVYLGALGQDGYVEVQCLTHEHQEPGPLKIPYSVAKNMLRYGEIFREMPF